MQSSAPPERRSAHFRAHERRYVQLDGALWHTSASEPVGVRVLNLGLAGAGIACSAVIHPDDSVMLSLLSETLLDPLVLSARVAWVQVPLGGAGLAYSGLAFDIPDRSVLLTLFQLVGSLTF